jgi:pantoate--beta-alanine ligase
VVGCETIRESDGLAFSSRNVHLLADERPYASIIYQSLQSLKYALRSHGQLTDAIASAVAAIESHPVFRVQYLEVVDSETLQPAERYNPSRPQRACIAVLTSRTRLIDNIDL